MRLRRLVGEADLEILSGRLVVKMWREQKARDLIRNLED